MSNSSFSPTDKNEPEIFEKSSFVPEIEDPKHLQVSSLTFEEKVRKAEVLLKHNPSFRHIFRHILERCNGQALILEDLEQFVSEQPHYAELKTPPYFPIHWLHEAFALEEFYLDDKDQLLTAEQVTHLNEDEFDDLVIAFAYRATSSGLEAANRFSPRTRLTQLFLEEPDRRSTYLEVLNFLKEKKPFASIEALLRNREVLQNTSRDGVKLQPSLFVDKLEATGAITYDGGWYLTPEGKEMLVTLE